MCFPKKSKIWSGLVALALCGALIQPVPGQLNPTAAAPTIDGSSADWGASITSGAYTTATNNATGATVDAQYSAEDAVNDDNGPGTYTYPDNFGGWSGSECDIQQFRVAYDATNLYVMGLFAGPDSDYFGVLGARMVVYIDRATTSSGITTAEVGSHVTDGQSPDIKFGGGFEFEFSIDNRAGFQGPYTYNALANTGSYPGSLVESESASNGCVEMRIPLADIGGPITSPELFKFIVGVGGEAGGGSWIPVNHNLVNANFNGSPVGGNAEAPYSPPGDDDADLIDLAGGVSALSQATDLAPTTGTFPTITACVLSVTLQGPPPPPPTTLELSTGAATIDGNPADWGTTITAGAYTSAYNNATAATVSAQFGFEDAVNDDNGPGSYTYPLGGAPDWTGVEHDIEVFRVACDGANLYFLTQFVGNTTLFGQFASRVPIYIDRETINSGVHTSVVGVNQTSGQSPDVRFANSFDLDFCIDNRAGFQGPYMYNAVANTTAFPGNVVESESLPNRCVEISVPLADIGGPILDIPETFKFIVGAGSDDVGSWRPVHNATVGAPVQFSFGGSPVAGDAEVVFSTTLSEMNDDDGDLLDLAGGAGAIDQQNDLACSLGNPPVISACILSVTIEPTAISSSGGLSTRANSRWMIYE